MAVQDSSNPGRGALRSVLASHNFRRLYSIRLAGQFGDGLLQSALATFVLFSPEREPDAVRVAAAFAILLLPYSLIGPFAGVLLDRWQRRNVLVRANLLKSLFTVPIIVVVGAGQADFVLGLFVLIVLGVSRFILAGLSASMPHVVNGRELITGNALAPTSGTIAVGVGGIIGVGIRSFVGGGDTGSQVVLVAAIVSFVVASFLATRLAAHALGPDHGAPVDTLASVARGLVLGARTLWDQVPARNIMVTIIVNRFVFGVLTAGALLLVRGSLHPPTDVDAALNDFVLATAGAAVGAFLGAVVTPTMTRRIGIGPWVGIVMVQGAVIGFGLLTATAITPKLVTLVAGAASIGLAGQSVKVCADTVLQRSIPDDRLGRVFALFDMIVNIALVTGITATAFASPISGQFTGGYLICAALLVLAAWWFRRSTQSPAQRS
ncbi:MAG: MFS transporter [Actinomycetia bacterium]|nr:MFS transporter [Actinomycetes bacterium]MCH9706951.1 MFS transporter [Actinomycetes bacterium]MCH9851100.1 MFS transporter [Actinomycetes bacterium]